MTSLGFLVSLVLFVLKVAGVAMFATLSWWFVVLPFTIAVAVDILLFAIFGFAAFKMFDRL